MTDASGNYTVYLHAFKDMPNGDRTHVDMHTDCDGYSVYVLNEDDLDDMPEDADFTTLAEAEIFANEMAEKYATSIEVY